MRFLLAAAILAALSAPVFAQQHMQEYGQPDKEKSATEKAADQAAADAYRRSLSNIPDKGSTDPWGDVRSDKPKAAATKTTKAKTKTGRAEAKPQ